MGMAQPQPTDPSQAYLDPSQQGSAQDPRSLQLPSPILPMDGGSAFPQGGGGGNEKTRRMRAHLELQRELLMQIEEKKRREEFEKREKKLQDLMDEERVRRENEEFNRIHGLVSDKLAAKNLHLSMATGPERKGGRATVQNNLDVSVQLTSPTRTNAPMQQTKSSLEDLRVIDELSSGRPKVEIEQKIIKELPIEVEKQVQRVVDEELRQLRAHFAHEQQGIGHELLNLKVIAK